MNGLGFVDLGLGVVLSGLRSWVWLFGERLRILAWSVGFRDLVFRVQ